MTTKLTFEIDAAANKQKLGEYLFDNLCELSKMYLRELIKSGKCEVNGRFENSGYLLRPHDFVEIEVDLSRGTAMRPENIPLDIVFEDAEIIVINKPAGMLVHPSHRENSGTLLNALCFYLNGGREAEAVCEDDRKKGRWEEGEKGCGGDGEEGRRAVCKTLDSDERISPSPLLPFSPASSTPSTFVRPGLPHRLDKQTSGLIVVAKTARAHRILSGHFMKKRVEKRYLALVEGIVGEEEGTIEAPIGRYADLKYWGVKFDGKHSESRFKVSERFADTTLLELEPVTGRTNQLRIHCEFIGHPVVGDVKRGGREFERLCLHAYRLAFLHPVSQERMRFEVSERFRQSLVERSV